MYLFDEELELVVPEAFRATKNLFNILDGTIYISN